MSTHFNIGRSQFAGQSKVNNGQDLLSCFESRCASRWLGWSRGRGVGRVNLNNSNLVGSFPPFESKCYLGERCTVCLFGYYFRSYPRRRLILFPPPVAPLSRCVVAAYSMKGDRCHREGGSSDGW